MTSTPAPQNGPLNFQSRLDPLGDSWNLIFEIGKPIVEAIRKINDKYNREQLTMHIANHRFWFKVPDCIFCTYESEVVEPRERNRTHNPLPQAYDEIDAAPKSMTRPIPSRSTSTNYRLATNLNSSLETQVEYENESSV